MELPLLSSFSISADQLPDRLLSSQHSSGFSLPGAQSLLDFAELLGDNPEDDSPDISLPQEAPFPLPAQIPQDVPGAVSLFCDVDFGALSGDRAVLTFSSFSGSGVVLLGGVPVARFDSRQPSLLDAESAFALVPEPCALAVDLTDALRLGRRETLRICFDETRPAGIDGPVLLRTTKDAFLSHTILSPDAAKKIMTLRTQITALQSGSYALRVLPVSPDPTAAPQTLREITLNLAENETRPAEMTLSVPAGVFTPGKPYDAPALKIQLLRLQGASGKAHAVRCDAATLLCGYPGSAPQTHLPLSAGDFQRPLADLIAHLKSLHISAVSSEQLASDGFYREMTRAGIGVVHAMAENNPARIRLLRHPCVSFRADCAGADVPAPVSHAASAWQMCSMTGTVRSAEEALSDRALLYEAAGRTLNPADEGVAHVLAWLRAVALRQRSEAARQGRYAGALCAPGETETPDVADAIRTAHAPLHLSALPLCGAWWTGTRFSAMLEAFIPDDLPVGPLTALAVLEDGEGTQLARLHTPCRAKGGYVGVIEAQLPDHTCVLELTTRLLCGDDVLEESVMPVYVGETGALEAAFI